MNGGRPGADVPIPAGSRLKVAGARLKSWFGAGPRRHGEVIRERNVSYLELFYDLVFVVLIGLAAHALSTDMSRRGVIDFLAVFGLIWVAWINGSLYHELHGRDDGRSRLYIFAQMLVLAVLAMFTEQAGGTAGSGFALAYSALLALLLWQWYEVWRRDPPEARPAATPYLVALLCMMIASAASSLMPAAPRAVAWLAMVVGWVILGIIRYLSESVPLAFFQPSTALVERVALFVIIVLGETVVGIVDGLNEGAPGPATVVTGLLALCVAFGVFWNHFDVVGAREPLSRRSSLATWFFSQLPLTCAIAALGAAMGGLIAHAQDSRVPEPIAWTLVVAVSVALMTIGVTVSSVDGGDARVRVPNVGYLLGVLALLLLPFFGLRPWLLASSVLFVLTVTWLSGFVPINIEPDEASNSA